MWLLLLAQLIPYALRVVWAVLIVGLGWFAGNAGARWLVSPPLTGPAAIAAKLHNVQDLATARVVIRTIQRGSATENGLLISNTDEILCRLLVTADYGFDLSAIGAERIWVQPGRITITLPTPRLLAPGFVVAPAELLDQRSTRWVTDAGGGHLAAVQAARAHAVSEAPTRIAELGVDKEVRETTRLALQRLLPLLLGDPTLHIVVAFDDEPARDFPPTPPPTTVPWGIG